MKSKLTLGAVALILVIVVVVNKAKDKGRSLRTTMSEGQSKEVPSETPQPPSAEAPEVGAPAATQIPAPPVHAVEEKVPELKRETIEHLPDDVKEKVEEIYAKTRAQDEHFFNFEKNLEEERRKREEEEERIQKAILAKESKQDKVQQAHNGFDKGHTGSAQGRDEKPSIKIPDVKSFSKGSERPVVGQVVSRESLINKIDMGRPEAREPRQPRNRR